jgi:hypothetical protein
MVSPARDVTEMRVLNLAADEATSTRVQYRSQAGGSSAGVAEAQEGDAPVEEAAQTEAQRDDELDAWLRRLGATRVRGARFMLEVFKDDAAKKSAFETMNESGGWLIQQLCGLVEDSVQRGELDAPRWLLRLLYRPTGRSTDGTKIPPFTPETRRFDPSLAWSRSTDVARRTALEAEYAAADTAGVSVRQLLRRYVIPPAAFEPDPEAAARHARHVAFYDTPFLGGALAEIKSKIREHEEAIVAKQMDPYARSFALYQSSGMGKSRLLYELCATETDGVNVLQPGSDMPIAGLSISLAQPTSTCIPAGDELKSVRASLSGSTAKRSSEARVGIFVRFFDAVLRVVMERFGSLRTSAARDKFASLSRGRQIGRDAFLRAIDEEFCSNAHSKGRLSRGEQLAELRQLALRLDLPADTYFVLGIDELSALTSTSGATDPCASLVNDVLRAWPRSERFWLLLADSNSALRLAIPTYDSSGRCQLPAAEWLTPFVNFPVHVAYRAYVEDKKSTPLAERSLAELLRFDVACLFGRPLWAMLPDSLPPLVECQQFVETKLLNGQLKYLEDVHERRAQTLVLLSHRVVLPAMLQNRTTTQEHEIQHCMRVVCKVDVATGERDQASQAAGLSIESGFPREPVLASAARRILALRDPACHGWEVACAALRSVCCNPATIDIGQAGELAAQIVTSIAYDRVLEPRRDELCGASDPADKGAWQEDSIITVHEFVSSLLGPEVASQLDDRLGACLMHFSRWFSLDKRCSSPSQQLLKTASITGIAYKGAAGQADWDLGESGAEHDERAAWPALAGLLPRRICSGLDGAMLLADALSSSHPGVDRPATRHRSPLRPPVHRNLRAGQESRKGQPADLQMVFRC